ncbi:hypothetical protein BC829DRAFT_398927 [Chytridium lagenaria]|nr:hypothetical protein BC829DRAFT_398927 [Chytridium lagenaria]
MQISSIRDTIAKEKELDLLTFKKNLTMQKESEIQDLRRELLARRESMNDNERTEFRILSQNLEKVNADLQHELQTLKQNSIPAKTTSTTTWASVQCDLLTDDHLNQLVQKDHDAFLKRLSLALERDISRDPISRCLDLVSDWRQTTTTLSSKISEKDNVSLSSQTNSATSNAAPKTPVPLLNTNTANISTTSNTSHDQELESLRTSFQLQLKLLQDDNTALHHHLEYENTLKNAFHKDREALFMNHADEIRRLKADFENERGTLHQRYHEEVKKTVEVVKARCFGAYENAVMKLKRDFGEFQEQTIAQHEMTIGDLKETLEETRKQHTAELEEMRQRFNHELLALQAQFRAHYTQQLREALEKMKLKYMTLLQSVG